MSGESVTSEPPPRDPEEMLFPALTAREEAQKALWGWSWERMGPTLGLLLGGLGALGLACGLFGAGPLAPVVLRVQYALNPMRNPTSPQNHARVQQIRQAQLADAQREWQARHDLYWKDPDLGAQYFGSAGAIAISTAAALESYGRTGDGLQTPTDLTQSPVLMFWPLTPEGDPKPIAQDFIGPRPREDQTLYWAPLTRWGMPGDSFLLSGPWPANPEVFASRHEHFMPAAREIARGAFYGRYSDRVALEWHRWRAIEQPIRQVTYLAEEWQINGLNDPQLLLKVTGLALVREGWEPILDDVSELRCYIARRSGTLTSYRYTMKVDGNEMADPGIRTDPGWQSQHILIWTLDLADPDLPWISRDDIPIRDAVP